MNPVHTSETLKCERSRRDYHRVAVAFTLMELLTVLVIISILIVLILPVVDGIKARMAKARCIANLRSLTVSTHAYVQQNGHWPQVDTSQMNKNYQAYASAWIEQLKPFGLSQINWICPSAQSSLRDPDLTKPEHIRLDYTATPFDANPATPYKWANQPWFIEKNSLHGNGNLIVYSDGRIDEALDVMRRGSK